VGDDEGWVDLTVFDAPARAAEGGSLPLASGTPLGMLADVVVWTMPIPRAARPPWRPCRTGSRR